jgi:phytoene dehydrogenase-like protein
VHPKLLFGKLLPKGAVPRAVSERMRGWATESATFRMNVALSELPRFTSLPEPGDHLTAGIIIAPSLAIWTAPTCRRPSMAGRRSRSWRC